LLNHRCLVCAFSNIAEKGLREQICLKATFPDRWFGEAFTHSTFMAGTTQRDVSAAAHFPEY